MIRGVSGFPKITKNTPPKRKEHTYLQCGAPIGKIVGKTIGTWGFHGIYS